MCGDQKLKVGDIETILLGSYSHVNHDSLSRAWLDFCLASEDLFSCMHDCRLLDIFLCIRSLSTQSEIYRGIFDNYGGTTMKIFDNYRGHCVGEV